MERLTDGLGLALGGGGMKGLAHIGAVSVIEKMGMHPALVAGTSIGSIVGAMYAAGMSAGEMKAAADAQPLLSLLSLRFDGKAMLDTSGVRSFLEEYVGDVEFGALKRGFLVTTTDLETGDLVLIDSGSVIDAVLASSAIPGLFAPVVIDDRYLMDGGMLENLPVKPLRDRGATQIIGVRLFYHQRCWKMGEARRKGRPDDTTRKSWRERISLEDLRHLPASVMERWLQAGHAGIEAFRIAQRGLDLMVSHQEAERLKTYPPDVLISPDVVDIGALDFHEDKRAVFESGVSAACAVEDALQKLAGDLLGSESANTEPLQERL